jgi:hypothetical protein
MVEWNQNQPRNLQAISWALRWQARGFFWDMAMAALEKTSFNGKITWLGRVPHRDQSAIACEALQCMALSFAGFADEFHGGLTRPSCSRVLGQYPRGTEIRNVRQLSVVSAEELALIASKLSLDAINPAWLGASIVVEGLPDFSHVPPSSRLQSQDGVTLTVDMLNKPCILPSKTIAAAGHSTGKDFKAAAGGLRGVTAWVERPGTLNVGDTLALHIPMQRVWAPQPDLFEI